jgi:hypothetical protein
VAFSQDNSLISRHVTPVTSDCGAAEGIVVREAGFRTCAAGKR